jgi:hypothetical protein
LVEAFPCCDTPQAFAVVIEWYDDEVIAEAIALQDSQHRRQELRQWFQQLSQPESTAGGELAQTEPIESELLRDRLIRCVNIPAFTQAIAGISDEQVKSAILELPERDRDRLKTYWRETKRQVEPFANATADLKPGCLVRVKERLLGDRLSLAIGYRGIIESVSGLGRLIVKFAELGNRIEPFSVSEVEFLGAG